LKASSDLVLASLISSVLSTNSIWTFLFGRKKKRLATIRRSPFRSHQVRLGAAPVHALDHILPRSPLVLTRMIFVWFLRAFVAR